MNPDYYLRPDPFRTEKAFFTLNYYGGWGGGGGPLGKKEIRKNQY